MEKQIVIAMIMVITIIIHISVLLMGRKSKSRVIIKYNNTRTNKLVSQGQRKLIRHLLDNIIVNDKQLKKILSIDNSTLESLKSDSLQMSRGTAHRFIQELKNYVQPEDIQIK